jgi:hypothetical protein
LNAAVQLRAALIVTLVESVVPAQSPPQPEKAWPEAGVAVRITVAPLA